MLSKPDYANVEWTDDRVLEEIEKFDQWFVHTDFGNGVVARSTAWPDASMHSTHMGISKFDYIVKPNLPNLQGKRVLELGCNNGLISTYMCRQAATEVIGIDCSDHWGQVIDQAEFVKSAFEYRGNTKFNTTYHDHHMGDLPQMGLGKFDIVIALNCLYYLEEAEIESVMRHVSEIADIFLIQCNTRDQDYLGRRPHPDYMQNALKENGFKFTHVDTRWDKPRKGFIPNRYYRPVVVGTNIPNYKEKLVAPW